MGGMVERMHHGCAWLDDTGSGENSVRTMRDFFLHTGTGSVAEGDSVQQLAVKISPVCELCEQQARVLLSYGAGDGACDVEAGDFVMHDVPGIGHEARVSGCGILMRFSGQARLMDEILHGFADNPGGRGFKEVADILNLLDAFLRVSANLEQAIAQLGIGGFLDHSREDDVELHFCVKQAA